MLNYLYRQNFWNFSDTIIGHFLTRNLRGQIYKTLTLEFWYLLSLCVIFRQNGNRWPIVELFPVKNSNVESENCSDSMSRLAIVKQPCQTEHCFLGHMCISSGYTLICTKYRVSVQGVKSLGSHFACLWRGFEFYEVKKKLLLFFKKKMEILLHF